ncbi:hypothetical protein, partial [Escherichia coli]|uniref:hypothetical protein n=1 Tax=Escherichia coli TaxID=562 RepID=UPI001954FDAB
PQHQAVDDLLNQSLHEGSRSFCWAQHAPRDPASTATGVPKTGDAPGFKGIHRRSGTAGRSIRAT